MPSRARGPKDGSTLAAGSPKTPSQLTHDALELLRQLVMYFDPEAAAQLPIDPPPDAEVPIPISHWNELYSSRQPTSTYASIKVSSYPSSSKNLFCVQSVLPSISARQFWTLMAESGNRHMWDSTVQQGGNFRWFEEELRSSGESADDIDLAKSIAARIEYLRMGAILMVAKARDMVILSADTRLPPSADSHLRMVSGCRSEEDPSKPPVKGYTRWPLGVGGFMVEELTLPDGGLAVRATQLSDLGELASWVPSSVVKMVASTLVPRSVNLIAKGAASIKPRACLSDPQQAAGCSLRDEDVISGRDRWSRGRPLPLQIGTGILKKHTAVQPPMTSESQTTASQEDGGYDSTRPDAMQNGMTSSGSSSEAPGSSTPTSTQFDTVDSQDTSATTASVAIDDEEEADQTADKVSQLSVRLRRLSSALTREARVQARASRIDPSLPEPDNDEQVKEPSISHPSDDAGEALSSAMAFAVSESLKSPGLLPELMPKSPPDRFSDHLPEAYLVQSPSRRSLQQEANQLSALLLARSDALIAAMAPGVRSSMASDVPSSAQRLMAKMNDDSNEEEDSEPETRPRQPRMSSVESLKGDDVSIAPSANSSNDLRGIFSGAWGGRPSQKRSVSSSSRPTLEAHSTHATSVLSYGDTSSDRSAAGRAAAEEDTRPPMSAAGKQQSNSTSYAAVLGSMAMMWTDASRVRAQPQSQSTMIDTSFKREDTSASAPSAAIVAARYALQRSASSAGIRPKAAQRSVSSPVVNRTSS